MLALYLREIRLGIRAGGGALTGVLFFLAVIATIPFAVGPDLNLLSRIGPAILWIGALLASLLGLDRLFQADREDGSLDLLILAGDRHMLALSVLVKCLAHWTASVLPLVIAAPVFGLILNMPPAGIGASALTLLVGTPAITFVGAAGAAVAVGLPRGGLLVSVLVLVLLVLVLPVLVLRVSTGRRPAVGPAWWRPPASLAHRDHRGAQDAVAEQVAGAQDLGDLGFVDRLVGGDLLDGLVAGRVERHVRLVYALDTDADEHVGDLALHGADPAGQRVVGRPGRRLGGAVDVVVDLGNLLLDLGTELEEANLERGGGLGDLGRGLSAGTSDVGNSLSVTLVLESLLGVEGSLETHGSLTKSHIDLVAVLAILRATSLN